MNELIDSLGLMKEADKVKLMLLAWNYHTQAQGKIFKQN